MADAFPSVLTEEQCEVGRDDAGGFGVSVGHERHGEKSGDDGLEDQGIRKIREYQDSAVPQGRHRDSPGRRWTDEDAPHHEFALFDDRPR